MVDVMIYYTNRLLGRERQKRIHIEMRVKLAAKLLLIVWTFRPCGDKGFIERLEREFKRRLKALAYSRPRREDK